MNRAKRLLALTTCLLAATTAAALSAAPAFAEGNWIIEGKAITALEKPEMEPEMDGESFVFLVPGLNFQLVFQVITYDKGALLPGGESSEVILFTKGTTYTISPKLALTNCKPGDLTFEVSGSLFLHGEKTYERLVPAKEGAPLTVTTYSEECPISEENIVTGNLVLEDSSGSFSKEAVSHLVRQAPAALFPTQMKFGSNAMNLLGSWWLKLKGAYGARKWSGLG